MANRVFTTLLALSFGFSLTECAQDRGAAITVATQRAVVSSLVADRSPHAGMLRNPDVSATHIVFGYANDLWLVSRDGGVATPVASPPGRELFPRFSPDGNSIAFVGNYEGNRDLYVVATIGGVARRVTHHPARETLCDWTSDGKLLFFSNAFAGLERQSQLQTVSPNGGLPEILPVPYGANGSISANGRHLAYTPHTRDHRTWKRYRGGMATDIWVYDLQTNASQKVTDWEGTDSQPMWWNGKLYYLSDGGPAHRLNIWSYDPASKRLTQITRLTDYDAKWPAIGPGRAGAGEIVYQNGPSLELLALDTGSSHVVNVSIPGDRPTVRPKEYDAKDFIFSRGISPTGKRAVFGARGDIWTAPAKKGSPRNLTRTVAVAERFPAWSPDGQWITYLSDKTGEYELYVMQSDGRGETRQLTSNGEVYRFSPTWSPDSKLIAFSDKSGAVIVHDIEAKETKQFEKNEWGGRTNLNWAADSRWIAYAKTGDNALTGAVWIYSVESGEKTQVTSGMFNDTWPTFDRKGDYLFFASTRDFTSPIYEDIGQSFVYANTDVLLAVPLRDEIGSPFAPKSDEEKWGDDEEDNDDDKDGDKQDNDDDATKDDAANDDGEKDDGDEGDDDKGKKKEKIEPIDIDLNGFERRAVQIPVDRGAFSYLSVNNKGHLLYVRSGARGSDTKPAIKIFDFEDDEKKEKTVIEESGSYSMSADGKKLLVTKGPNSAIVDAKADQEMKDVVDLTDLRVPASEGGEVRQQG